MWHPAPAAPELREGDVHVWMVRLDQPAGVIGRLVETLSDAERERVRALRFERDRRRFTVARGVLRSILGRYLVIDPAAIRFAYGAHGKPTVAQSESELRFNLSHSDECALYGVTLSREIGIDVEHVRALADGDDVAQRFFSAHEVAVYRALAPGERVGGFFRCWTRKEAFIKAIGNGLSYPLDRFDVTLAPGEPARLLRIEGDPLGPARWSLVTLEPGSCEVAAVAVPGAIGRLEHWRWSPEP